MSEEREPLLHTGTHNFATGKDGARTQATNSAAATAAVPLRMLSALRAGQLPNNVQLNAMLHAVAAFLETLSRAVLPNASASKKYGATPSSSSAGPAQDNDGNGAALSNETVVTLAALLKECATLCYSLAQWITGDARQAADVINADQTTPKIRGNANEQWQRMFWHLAQSLSNETPIPVQMDTKGDGIQAEAREAVENVRTAAETLSIDVSQGVKSIIQIALLVMNSDEVYRIPSDILRSLQTSLANVAGAASERAANAQEELKPPQQSEDSFAKPTEAVQDATNAIASAVDAAVLSDFTSSSYDAKGKQRSTQTLQDEIARRLARLLEGLRDNDAFCRAANTFVKLSRKYMQLAADVRDDVQAKVQTQNDEGQAQNVEEEVKATLKSAYLDSEVSVHLSHHATQAGNAIKEVLEGLAGGLSMDTVIERVEKLKDEVQSDSELRKWFHETLDVLSGTINARDGNTFPSSEKIEEDLKRQFAQLQALLQTRPSIQRTFDDLLRSIQQFNDALQSNSDTRKLRARLHHIIAMAKRVFVYGVRDAKEQAHFAISSLFYAIIPSLGQILGNIPLPRIEFTSDKLDAALDDIHIGALDLIPSTVRVSTTQDWLWQRDADKTGTGNDKDTASHIDTDVRVSVGGLRLAMKDVSFYVQERYTAPTSTSCFSCCSFGRSQSDWCILRGPSSWLAYTESALLDVGFSDKGAGVMLDLRDAGQDLRKRQRYTMWPFGNAQKNADIDARDAVTKQFRSIDEQEEDEEQSPRSSFFSINDCRVDVDDSFEFRLRNSRHWIVNALIGASVRPILKVLLRRIVGAQIRHAFTAADQYAYDVHRRARLTRNRRIQKWSVANDQQTSSPDDLFPEIRDYITVLFDAQAGKSKARLLNEREEERKRQEEERKREDEEADERLHAQQREQDERDGDADTEGGQGKSFEVKRAGVIMHDEDGEYSVAIGVKPTGLLLDARQRGPMTQRMRVRQAMANPKQTARQAALYGNEIKNASKQALLNDEQTNDDRDLLQAPKAVAQKARSSLQTAQDVLQDILDPHDADGPSMQDDEGWKSDAFDF